MTTTTTLGVGSGSSRRRRTGLIPRDAWFPALLAWLAARLVVAVAYVITRQLDADGRLDRPNRLGEGLLAWDGGWYAAIAENGYRAGGEELRFAPLYPLLGRIVGLPAGDRPTWGLVAVANLAALVAGAALIAYLRRLRTEAGLVHRQDERRTELVAAMSLALWPAGFVLVFAYAESLLLASTILAALAARQGRWWTAAAFGLVAGASRPTGMALAVFLAALVWTDRRPGLAGLPERPGRPVELLAAVAAPFVGFATHLATARWVGAAWLAPIDIQEPLRGELVDPFSRLWRGAGDLVGDERWGDGLHFPFAVLAVVLVILVAREVGLPEALLTAVTVIVALSAANWNSLERYVANAFPVFVALGLILGRSRWAALILMGSATGLGLLTMLAWSGRYVP